MGSSKNNVVLKSETWKIDNIRFDNCSKQILCSLVPKPHGV